MNPISAGTGALGAAARSILGYFRNRRAAKDMGLPRPKFRWWRLVESIVEGAVVGLLDPEPITAGMIGYFGSDAIGKGLRLTPARRVLPRIE